MAVKSVSRFGIQRKIVANMTTESWQNIPHVSYQYEPDVTKFVEEFKKFTAEHQGDSGAKITFNAVLLKAIAEAIEVDPVINAHMHYEKGLVRGKVTVFDNIDISVPWILPSGEMMTITMKDMGNKTLKEIAEYQADINRRLEKTNLTEALYSVSFHDTVEKLKKGHILKAIKRLYGANTNKRHRIQRLKGAEKKAYNAIPVTDRITRDDLKQGTITVSNIGADTRGLSGECAMLMVIPPQVCVICIGAMQRRPVVVKDEDGNEKVEIRTILPLNICFDHRALDFGEVRPFISKMEEFFKNPEKILNDKA
ncbi:MAG: 2-oxo acid dehydrogenase subunit E2 [Ruminococcaceae bacterium]|nr:2-oxo acid dehydrogenase subunit E2 [Oscillospiraceae bacterium]